MILETKITYDGNQIDIHHTRIPGLKKQLHQITIDITDAVNSEIINQLRKQLPTTPTKKDIDHGTD